MRRFLKAGIPLMALATVFLAASPALACTTDHQFLGATGSTFSSNTLFATRAEVTTDSALQNCESSSFWVMLMDPNGGSDYRFAQIGLLQENGQTQQQVFYEYATTDETGPPEEIFTAPAGKYAYKVVYDGSSPNWYFYWNGNLEFEVGGPLGWTPIGGEYYSEVWATQDYVPGTPSNPESMSQIQYRESGSTWYNYGGSYQLNYTYPTTYGRFASNNADNFSVYDSRA